MKQGSKENQETHSEDMYQVFTPEGEKRLHQRNHVFDHTIRPNLK